MSTSAALQAPPKLALLGEARVLLDLSKMAAGWLRRPPAAVSPRQIMVLPGFGADDWSTLPLRQRLNRAGHCAVGWGLGRNRAGVDIAHDFDDIPAEWAVQRPAGRYRGEGSVLMLCERVKAQIRQRAAECGPLTLIGWSLGGYLAREAARDLPEQVEQVVTLGSPVVGGPKYTAAASYFRRLGMNLDWIESEIKRRQQRPIKAPITAIVSCSDGVVAYPAALDTAANRVEHIVIDAAHIGLCFNPAVWRLIERSLDAQAVSTPR